VKAEEADARVGIAIKGAFEIGNAVITIMRSDGIPARNGRERAIVEHYRHVITIIIAL
jgi:hypothetical protein